MAFEYPPSPHTRVLSPPLQSPTSPTSPTRRYHAPPSLSQAGSPRTPTQASTSLISSSFSFKPAFEPGLLLTPLRREHNPHEHLGRRHMTVMSTSPSHGAQAGPHSDQQITGWKPTLPAVRPFFDQSNAGSNGTTGSNGNKGVGVNLAVRRRQSRLDPMGKEEEMEDDGYGYGELGARHPLRRVAEEDPASGKEEGAVSLPGIKALFGVAGGQGDNQQPPTPSSSGSMYASPSLPSLTPNSPSSSPSTARTSRYSSLGSAMSATSETHHHSGVPTGWWAPDFERSGSSGSSPMLPPNHRANSYPSTQAFIDEHADKRRRSDGPPALRDAEESARLRWQAQSRNASYPAASPGGPSTPSGLRSLLHPPPASSSMSRHNLSGSSGLGTPMSPRYEQAGTPDGYFADRRIAPVPSRSSSIVGGQLAQSFADLSASERRSPLPHPESLMGPPSLPSPADRRGSSYQGSRDISPRPSIPALNSPRASSIGPGNVPNGSSSDALRRQSLTRPSTPEVPARPALNSRRSSLTEMIMANSGDNLAMASGKFNSAQQSVALERPSMSEPLALSRDAPHRQSAPAVSGWQPSDRRIASESWHPSDRRISVDSTVSTPARQGISLNSDGEGSAQSQRGRKRSGQADERDMDAEHMQQQQHGQTAMDHAMRGMEVLAESARRVQEEMDEDSPPGQVVMGGAGPKYACAFCAKTFSRPSSLRIHTYSHTGERPYVCKEPTCRRRFSVQSNLKRHAKVHQLGTSGQMPTLPGPQHAGIGGRPIERSHRHGNGLEGQPGMGGQYYHSHPQGQQNAYGPGGYAHGPGGHAYAQGYGYEQEHGRPLPPHGQGHGRDYDDEEEEEGDDLDEEESEDA